MSTRAGRSLSERLVLLVPYVWLLVFFLAPFAMVAKISVSQAALAQPPYTPVFEGLATLSDKLGELTAAAYRGLADDRLYLDAYLSSLRLAGIATLLTLLVAYPMAYGIANVRASLRPALVLLAVAPFWTSFLIRVYAWITILKDEGLLNTALRSLGMIDEPLHIFATDWAVMIGIVYSYLPFMVLPVYNAIAKQDPTLLEAAADLAEDEDAAGRLAVLAKVRYQNRVVACQHIIGFRRETRVERRCLHGTLQGKRMRLLDGLFDDLIE